MRRKIAAAVVVCAVALMAAPVAHAGPVESGWLGRWADAWQSVLAVFGASSTETTTEPEPEPEPVPPPKSEPPTTSADSCPTCGESDGGPGMDPNG